MTSSSPQATSRRSWVSADMTIGPRQIIGVSSSTRKPIDMTLTPYASSGFMIRPSTISGFPESPKRRGIDGPEDIGVEEADAKALLGERDGEVAGRGRFADAALAGCDRDRPA